MAGVPFLKFLIEVSDLTDVFRDSVENRDIALIDILDVILDKGVAIKGDLIISIAGIDLVYIDLRILIASVETLVQTNTGGLMPVKSDFSVT